MASIGERTKVIQRKKLTWDSKKKGLPKKSDIPSFLMSGRPPLNFYPVTLILSLGAKTLVLQGTGYCMAKSGQAKDISLSFTESETIGGG
jgi:hypothetical protein